jgi:hypothetical protein
MRTDPLTRATMPAIKHGSDDPQDGVSVAAAPRREHPENSEHVASLHPWQQYRGRQRGAP